MTRRYLGTAGHFCAADSCRFRLHTHVNGFCVSTVGEYYPRSSKRGSPPEEIGRGRLYETMVFPLASDDTPLSLAELEMCPYNDEHSANLGHEDMVCKYEALR